MRRGCPAGPRRRWARRPWPRRSPPRTCLVQPADPVGVLDFNPVQYRTPLYQLLSRRARVELGVFSLTDDIHSLVIDPGSAFGSPGISICSPARAPVPGDVRHAPPGPESRGVPARRVSGQDAVVIHGYSHPWMLLAALLCRTRRVPCLFRGVRPARSVAGLGGPAGRGGPSVVSASAGGLAIGRLNEEFYRQYGAPRIVWAPYLVDDERFASPPPISRAELLSRWDLDGETDHSVLRETVLAQTSTGPGRRRKRWQTT